jgi:hypothetical protein
MMGELLGTEVFTFTQLSFLPSSFIAFAIYESINQQIGKDSAYSPGFLTGILSLRRVLHDAL